MSKVIITGVAGCIGSWIAKHLLEDGHEVVGADLATAFPRFDLLDIANKFPVHLLDVTNLTEVEALLERERPDAVIHLASLLMPKCKSDPLPCVAVNVTSFMGVLELARKYGFAVAYASSAWVHAPTGTDELVGETDKVEPQSLYGVFKHTNEGMARIYAQEYGVEITGFRPYIVYGPGRDVGLTADVSQALLAAARGESYEIEFGGTVLLHHASDIARAFIKTALEPKRGGRIYNLRGSVVKMEEVVATIEKVTNTTGLVSFKDIPLPIAANLSDAAFQRDYGPFDYLELENGMRQTLETYRSKAST
jgi:nucleoside-diphosphate-sugar epimerase